MSRAVLGCLGCVLSVMLSGCSSSTPAPVTGLDKDYTLIERGSYRGRTYQVQKGDTLYFIAYIANKDVKELIEYNNLTEPYTIHPGQTLFTWRPAYTKPVNLNPNAATTAKTVIQTNTTPTKVVLPTVSASTAIASTTSQNPKKDSSSVKEVLARPVEQSKPKEYVAPVSQQKSNKVSSPVQAKSTPSTKPKTSEPKLTTPTVSTVSALPNNKVSKWLWPTKGRIIRRFSAGDQGNKGIDIAGQRGQAVIATAAGSVVYSGNALRGYGNLIIIKHNDDYLSAYAHNDTLLVSEGQQVRAGQKIATMGSSGADSVRLHFEIRYQGKSVNPNRYLP